MSLDVAKKRISELEDIAIKSSKTEKQSQQRQNKQKRIFKDRGISANRSRMEIPVEEREEGTEEIFETLMTENFPK